MSEVTATGWLHLQEILFEDSWNKDISRFRSSYAFRGLNCAHHDLSTSLMRYGKSYPNMERNLIKQFQKYARKHVVERDTEWHWLSIAQHHGLPTRLLDWTYSPYIALHFATSNPQDFDEDGAIWMVNFVDAHKLLQASERHELEKYGSSIFSIDMLGDTLKDLDSLDKKHAHSYDAAIFFEPPTIDDRIVNQFAYFSVISDPNIGIDQWLKTSGVKGNVRWKKIIIPKHIKWEVRDKLDQANITERILFPGLDGLCKWLTRHYQPR